MSFGKITEQELDVALREKIEKSVITVKEREMFHQGHLQIFPDGRALNLGARTPADWRKAIAEETGHIGRLTFFIGKDVMGVPADHMYGHLTTALQWVDASGGNVYQIFETETQTFKRRATSETTWGLWVPLAIVADTRPSGANLNDYKTAGTYPMGGSLINGALGAEWGVLIVEVSGDVILQTLKGIGDDIWVRRMTLSTTWTPWTRILTQGHYDQLFNSVSNGKSAIANAVTQKGIPTAADAEFAVMANNIAQIPTGSKVVTGTAVSNSSLMNVSYVGSGSTTSYVITGGFNLGFVPRIIIAWASNGNTTYMSVYNALSDGIANGTETVKLSYYSSTTTNMTSQNFKANMRDIWVNANSFRIPVIASGLTYTWIAVE